MAVPSYGGLKVTPSALPGPRLSPDAPLEAFGGGPHIEKASRLIEEINVREKRRADEIAVLEGDRKLGEFENTTLYHPETGVLNRRGKDAMGLPEKVSDDFNKAVDEISAGMGNDDQRVAFGRFARARKFELDKHVQRHVFTEIREHDKAETNAYVAVERDLATQNVTDPARVQLSIDRQTAALRDFARRNGYDLNSAVVTKLVSDATSDTHTAVINRMLAGGLDLAAKDYYDKNKAQIDGKDATALEKSLQVGLVRGESQREADRIMAVEGVTREIALADVRKIKDPQVRDAANALVNNRFNEIHVAQREALDRLYLGAANVVERSKSVASIPPAQWTQLSLEQRNALESRAKHLSAGTEPAHNPTKWVEFLDLTPTQLADMDGSTFQSRYQPHFDRPHFDAAARQWALARDAKRDPSKRPELSSMQTDKEMVTNAFVRAINKPDRKNWSDDDKRAFNNFSDQSSAAVQRYELTQLNGKRKATDEEKQKIVNGLLMQRVVVDRAWYNPMFDYEKPAVLLTDDERKGAYVPFVNIPDNAKVRMVNLAKSWGVVAQNMDQKEAERILSTRLEKAYGASLAGQSDDIIKSMLMGGRR